MKIEYIEHNFSRKSLETIDKANAIIEEYEAEGYKLTLRQLYYQFVARFNYENSEKSYDRLGETISKARLAGLISWEAIEDRTRYLREVPTWNSPAEIIRAARNSYRIPMWVNQPVYIEVGVEKDAALNAVERVCEEFDVGYISCRGYTSQSAQWAAAQRFENAYNDGKECIFIYVGDHDPSGIDMGRDHRDRLTTLFQVPVGVRRIALNMDQIEQYKPPPNPTKVSDSRSGEYIRKFGHTCWELDALSPKTIEALVRKEIEALMDHEAWAERMDVFNEHKARLDNLLRGLE